MNYNAVLELEIGVYIPYFCK